MLESTLATEFVSGSNLKGQVAGANWTFVLPSLELHKIVVVGLPTEATLRTLSRLASEVVLVCRRAEQFRQAYRLLHLLRLPNIRPLLRRRSSHPLVPAGTVDLVVIAGAAELWRIATAAEARSEVAGWLTEKGTIYTEAPGFLLRLLAPRLRFLRPGRTGRARQLWLTPATGESHTFIPLEDSTARRYFRRKGLTSVSIRPDILLRWKSRAGMTAGPQAVDSAGDADHVSASQARSGTRKRRKRIMRTAVHAAVQWSNQLERWLTDPTHLGRLFSRRGAMWGAEIEASGSSPPQYLCDIARQAGVYLDSYRWALLASGDYASRKLVFFLFPPNRETPQYVIKMTRAAQYNRRLQQEEQALRLLEQQGIGDLQTLPRIAFSGTHGGLMVVGETAIEGVPFDQRTTAAADCPYARAAVDWLTELGASTASPCEQGGSELAVPLGRLLERFGELYPITADERAWLQAQITLLADTPVPAVFQHGDPGRWNVHVPPNGRISFLDWEAAEPHGVPLWDLFYFLRSFCMAVAAGSGHGERLESLDRLLFRDSPVATLVSDSIRNYCLQAGVPLRAVEPLFYTCWMHRALKEAARLPAGRTGDGHYFHFLRLCLARRNTPEMQQLILRPQESHGSLSAVGSES